MESNHLIVSVAQYNSQKHLNYFPSNVFGKRIFFTTVIQVTYEILLADGFLISRNFNHFSIIVPLSLFSTGCSNGAKIA